MVEKQVEEDSRLLTPEDYLLYPVHALKQDYYDPDLPTIQRSTSFAMPFSVSALFYSS